MTTANPEIFDALQMLAADKGISVDTLLEALANALVSAYKRMPGAAEEAYVTIDADTFEIRVYGQELDEDGNVTREWDDTPPTSVASPPRRPSRCSCSACARPSAS